MIRASRTTKVGFVSLGCPKNLVDTEVMLGTLAGRGYEITHDQQAADVIVVNTCAFIDTARQESIDTILEMARLKIEGRCRKLVVAGCLAERYRDQIAEALPEVDLAFGPDELGRILEAVIDDPAPDERISIDALYTSREVPTIPRLRTTPPHLAYLKISEGCDHACAFCAIPGFRGSFRSRTRENLLAEARRLADDGVRELVLVSQDTLAWGKDLGGGEGLRGLLEGLLEVAPLRWIRLLYCYPNLLSSSLIELIASEDRLCNYFDIPFQHASARVLERMRRGGSREGFARQIDRIRQRVPGASIRTSFIVGFPGETDEDFAELAQFVEETGFDHLGVFIYSDEDGTAAIRLDGKVKPGTARARRNKLMERQARITKRRLGRLVGATLPVMLEGLSSESDLLLEGRTEGQAPEIDGRVLINDAGEIDPAAGRIYRTEITRALEYDLVGRIVGEC
jgi:ribosomal protein S12 methylthiotransferase